MADRVLVTLDGEVHDPDVPLLHADDLAAVRGDGVFETVLVRGGRAVHDRAAPRPGCVDVRGGAGPAGAGPGRLARWRVETGRRRSGAPSGEGVMRLVLSRGRESGGDADRLSHGRPGRDRVAGRPAATGCRCSPWPRGYSVDLAATRAVAAARGEDAVLRDQHGGAAVRARARRRRRDLHQQRGPGAGGAAVDGASSRAGGTLITPPLEHGILPGTTQRALFEVAGEHGFRCEVRRRCGPRISFWRTVSGCSRV